MNRRPYIAMEHVDGSSLREVIRSRGPLPPGEASRIAISLVDALSTAHEAGVVHRDIKPANILGVSPGRHEVLARVMAGHGGSVYQDSAIVVVEPGTDLRMKLNTAGSAISLKINQEE